MRKERKREGGRQTGSKEGREGGREGGRGKGRGGVEDKQEGRQRTNNERAGAAPVAASLSHSLRLINSSQLLGPLLGRCPGLVCQAH